MIDNETRKALIEQYKNNFDPHIEYAGYELSEFSNEELIMIIGVLNAKLKEQLSKMNSIEEAMKSIDMRRLKN